MIDTNVILPDVQLEAAYYGGMGTVSPKIPLVDPTLINQHRVGLHAVVAIAIAAYIDDRRTKDIGQVVEAIDRLRNTIRAAIAPHEDDENTPDAGPTWHNSGCASEINQPCNCGGQTEPREGG